MKLGDQFISMLHERFMKPWGFKKKSHTFSRAQAGYEEHYNIQGSAWNSSGAPWLFYVNCAISFPDIPLANPGSGMWKFHAHARLPKFVREAPGGYDVSNENLEAVVVQVGEELKKCSEYFSRRHKILRESYLDKRYDSGFLRDPELNDSAALKPTLSAITAPPPAPRS
jgi:hypothetical protein